MKRLTILMLTNTYVPILGGLEKSVQAFSGELRRRGHRVVVVAPAYEGAPEREAHVIRLPAIQHFNGTDFSVNLPVPGLLSKLMNRIKPDVLHAHHPFLVGDMALRLAGQHHVPLVFTHHTMFEQYDNFPLEMEPAKRFVVELATGFANLCDQVIAPSESVRDLLVEKGVKRPIAVVPTGMDPEFFRRGHPAAVRRKFKIPAGAFVAGHIGRLSPEKNLEFLSKAVAEFLKREPKAHFLYAGKGPSEEYIRKVFQDAGVGKRAHFAGVLKGKDLMNAYQAMDAFAFASQSETQGMVVTEAMASAVPVVAVDANGVRDAVRDRKNGRLLAREDVGEFAEALSWMAHLNAASRKKIVAAARATAKDFSLPVCTNRLLDVYGRVRRHRKPFKEGEHPWLSVMGRIKTELGMIANVGKAAGAAILETAAPKEDVQPEQKMTEPKAPEPKTAGTS